MSEEKRVLNPEQAAKELGIGRNLVYRLLRNKTLPHIKAGDRYLIPVSALEKWLAECGQGTPAAAK